MIKEIGRITNNDYELLRMWEVHVPTQKRIYIPHSHIQLEMVWIAKGSGTYFTESQTYQITAGDFFVFSSNEVHYITEIGPKGLEIINLHIEPHYLFGRSMDSLSIDNRNFCFYHSPDFSNQLPKEDVYKIKEDFLLIKSELEQKKPEYPLIVKSLLNKIIVTLIRDFHYVQDSDNVPTKYTKELQKVLAYIDNHLEESITLDQMARMLHITPNYFSKLFHDFSHMRFQDYVNSRRIEKAQEYLLNSNTDLTILDIAILCGFNNTANFNKAFRKFVGCTPREFRASDSLQNFI